MAIESGDQASLNPYAAPKAPVADSPAAAGEPTFFAVGLLKLSIMSVVTFGLYEFYWSYRNWKQASRLSGEKLNAPIRAVFYPLTSYFLFRRIDDYGAKRRTRLPMGAGTLAFFLFVLNALWRLPDPYWLVSFASFLPLLAVQATVNEINREVAPGSDPNTRFRAWNIVAAVLGGAWVALVLIGLFFMHKPAT
jgi:hypothetical protein